MEVNMDKKQIKNIYQSKLIHDWNTFLAVVSELSFAQILSCASKIAAAKTCFKKLLAQDDENFMLYLLRFENPLYAVMEGYLALQVSVAEDDILETVSDMMDEPETDLHHSLDPEWAEDCSIVLNAFQQKLERNWQDYFASLDGLH